MIASQGGDVNLLALSPIPLQTKLVGDVKELTSLFENNRGHTPRCCGVACFTCIHWLGGGERSYMDG